MPEDRRIFHPSGWTAVPDRTMCNGCRKCSPEVNGCPVEAITFDLDGKVTINQEICVGCGICKTKCDKGVIKIMQTMPMRKDLHEYFLKDYNLDIKLWNNDNE
jgi:Fe-S-cluster-containing hydrogenase component 2